MKIFHIILFVIIAVIALLGIAIEVINPHSFLNATGAFIRVAGILTIMPIWMWLSHKGEKRLKLPGILLLLVTSMAYLWFGFSDLRQNALYEKQKTANQEGRN